MVNIDRWGVDIFRIADLTTNRPLTVITYTIMQVKRYVYAVICCFADSCNASHERILRKQMHGFYDVLSSGFCLANHWALL